jgi:chromosome segregation ATPase
MQSDVEGARRQAKEAETYWKSEMTEFQQEVAAHLQAAENGEEGSDARLQKLMEKLKVGIADKYAKLRRKATRTEKELQQTQDKLAAVERIMAKREEEEARLRKLIEEMEARENIPGAKKPGSKPDTEPKKKPARKKK